MYEIKIAVVEDDDKLRDILKRYLENEGYSVDFYEDGESAIEGLGNYEYSLAVLDVMLPDMDGWSILRTIRRKSKMPVVMLTARSEEEDKLFGFELGADDYITKPFSGKELIARIKALLKRSMVYSVDSVVDIGTLSINTQYRQVKADQENVDLTPIEYDLLLCFVDNVNIALSRDKILDIVWGMDYYGDERTVDTHIKRLRKKLGKSGEMIETVRGYGYRMGDKHA